MGIRIDYKDLTPEQQAAVDKQLGKKPADTVEPKKANKYHATRTVVDGIVFDSKLEASYYERLKLLKAAGEIKYFLRQVPFGLPGNIKYRVDFQIFNNDNTVSYIDTKGYLTPQSRDKIKQVEALYPVKIQIVKKGG